MKGICLTVVHALLALWLPAQDTFSIVAVDSATGEVGSAGASCLQAPSPPTGVLIISDVVPGKGAIHTQSYWNSYNQLNARGYMELGHMPKEILYHVNLDDFDGDSTIRQYGIALFDSSGHPRTGAYTGDSCFDYKNHKVGSYYSVQGNILLGQFILDSIEARFLNTSGSLTDRLMAALQGANVPGADSRCLTEGVPSQSSFLRVAKPSDDADSLYLDLNVKSRPYGMSPIDSLQTLYNAWKQAQPSSIVNHSLASPKISPNPASGFCTVEFADARERNVEVYDILGNLVFDRRCFSFLQFSVSGWRKGVYILQTDNKLYKLLVQ